MVYILFDTSTSACPQYLVSIISGAMDYEYRQKCKLKTRNSLTTGNLDKLIELLYN
jgi:hypothetical protein